MHQANTQRISKWCLLLSALLSLSIILIGSYYVLLKRGAISSQAGSNPSNIVAVDSYPVQPDNWTLEADRVDIVVEGIVKEVLPAKWTTPDGKPASARAQGHNPSYQIRTPVRIDVQRAFKGAQPGRSLVFSFNGGRVDTATVVSENSDLYKPGARLLLFLNRGQPGTPAHVAHPSGLWTSMAFAVDDGVLHGPIEDVPVSEVVTQLLQVQP